jgi:hypothetical protein
MSPSLARCQYMHFPFRNEKSERLEQLNHEGTAYSNISPWAVEEDNAATRGGCEMFHSALTSIGLVHQHGVNNPETGLGREAGRDAIVSQAA